MTDAVSLLLESESGQIQVRARCGRFGRYQGIVVTVALLDAACALSEATETMAVERLAGRALAYGGVVQCRRNRVRMVLLEMPAPLATRPRIAARLNTREQRIAAVVRPSPDFL